MEAQMWALAALLLAGVRCEKEALFVYSRLGGDALLPCASPPPDSPLLPCSSVSWTFYKGGRVRYSQEVSRGRTRADSDKADRMSLASDCSLGLRGLRVEDAGSYVCLRHEEAVSDVYLSLLTVASSSSAAELRPGGRLALSCVLHTYYDAGSCRASDNRQFELRWLSGDGGALEDGRHQLIGRSRCNVTLVTTLQADDPGRRWRCQLNATGGAAESIDVRPAFLFGDDVPPPPPPPPPPLPISRIALCASLPLMVLAVGLFTWRRDRNNENRDAAGA